MFDHIAQNVIDQEIILNHQLITIRRLDLIHPQISGNKFFKLKHNFIEAKTKGFNKLLTFGGAFSNHIAATAFAAHHFGFQSVGIIRGEELEFQTRNHTLALAEHFGMKLHFISRQDYRQKNELSFLKQLENLFPDHYVIPEGGTNDLALKGTREILNNLDQHFDIICCAVGTGGTIAGIIESSQPHQQILGFSALKGDFLTNEVQAMTSKTNWKILDDYCFGGYAKTNSDLIDFIQQFETQHNIPLEQIYTGKMLFGLSDLIAKNTFSNDSKILVIHTGGLQGRSFSI